MRKKTKFYYKLLEAKNNNEVALIEVIDRIMPLIEGQARNEYGKIDEDLKSYLIECVIKTIKTEGFAEKLLKN